MGSMKADHQLMFDRGILFAVGFIVMSVLYICSYLSMGSLWIIAFWICVEANTHVLYRRHIDINANSQQANSLSNFHMHKEINVEMMYKQ